MQLGQLIRIVNGRWAGIFGGVAGAAAAIVVQWQFSALSTGRAALLVGLLTMVFFVLIVVLTNLTGLLPRTARGNSAIGND
ncbi:MAG: hypothetical protein J07HN6_02618 [Halonotius sp. J07HN6]|jgi:hypothetical protein|nr:MAG: hypothetical protein J07HN6_02618 [Halonotius sp. J07HN6]